MIYDDDVIFHQNPTIDVKHASFRGVMNRLCDKPTKMKIPGHDFLRLIQKRNLVVGGAPLMYPLKPNSFVFCGFLETKICFL